MADNADQRRNAQEIRDRALDAMKVFLLGKNREDLLPLLRRHAIDVVDSVDTADLVVTYGGDGSLIGAESAHPGTPKLGMRDDRSCDKCELHRNESVIERLAGGACETTRLMKLSAEVGGRTPFYGMNDILLRNRDIRSAVRFSVAVNHERVTDEIIGDGLVISTPFGSSAYFRSITNTTFRTGIGVAFNNCTEFLNHLVLREEDEIRVRIVRGPADLTSDNHAEIVPVDAQHDIVIRKSERTAEILGMDNLRCTLCRYKHAPRRRF